MTNQFKYLLSRFSFSAGIIVISILLFSESCKTRRVETATETLVIYGAADSLLEDGQTMVMVPVDDHVIMVDSTLSLEEKIRILADTLSDIHFNGLEINLLRLSSIDDELILVVNLEESNKYSGPGSLAPYNSWYDYFQGSYGGQSTSIILTNTLLQREYRGVWPSMLEIYYNGNPMEHWDHITLAGRHER